MARLKSASARVIRARTGAKEPKQARTGATQARTEAPSTILNFWRFTKYPKCRPS